MVKLNKTHKSMKKKKYDSVTRNKNGLNKKEKSKTEVTNKMMKKSILLFERLSSPLR